ncbi:MAG: mechanosensitive ion channel [Herpetosiphon sp.]
MNLTALVATLIAFAPKLIGALVILIVGLIVASIVARIVKAALQRSGVGARLGRALDSKPGSTPPDVSGIAGTVVYYLILLFVLVAFFQALEITSIITPLNALLIAILAFAPRLIGAVVLLVVALVVATIVRIVVLRLLTAARLDERLGQSTPQASTPATSSTVDAGRVVGQSARGSGLSVTLAQVVYFLILLFFLPGILDALGLQGLLGPVQGLLNQILGFIPNLISAAIILIVGWFVATLVRRIVSGLLAAAGIDRLSDRLGLSRTLGAQRLSGLLGLIVYLFILLPVLVSALSALRLDAVTVPVSNLLTTIVAALPLIISAAVLLIISYVVARVVATLVTNLLAGIGFNRVPLLLGMPASTLSTETTPAQIAGGLVLAIIMLFATIQALQLLQFVALATIVIQFTELLGRAILAVIIFALGLYLAGLVGRALTSSGMRQSNLISQVARMFITVLASSMALRELGIANTIIDLAFGLLIGAIAVAVALAFGLGGREFAARTLETWRLSMIHERRMLPTDPDQPSIHPEP